MYTTRAGQKLLEAYFNNTGGLNFSDSTFAIKPEQATGGYNFDYVKTGGIQKSLCPSKTSASPDAQLNTLGVFLRNTRKNVKSIIRAAGTKIQVANIAGAPFTDLAQDTTAASTNFLSSTSTQPVVGAMTTTPTSNVLWLAGGGMDGLYGVPGDAVTANGVSAPTGALALSETAGGGSWATAGTYFYAVAFRKLSTQAISNAALDLSIAVTNASNTIEVDLSGITNVDATLYDKIYLYRSAVASVSGFTAGDLVAQIDPATTTYSDTGTSLTSAGLVPRNGNTILDNSRLPSGTYESLVVFKRRLVTASDSTVYLSDLNKFESWPAQNVIEVPSGGKITGLAIISFTTPSATTTDEFLAVFKEQELWIITGDSSENYALKFIDSTGSLNQSLIVGANGYLYFIDYRGIYLWDGAGKPVYISRIIEDIFSINGKLDKALLYRGFGSFFRRQNEVIWCLSSTDVGEQKYILKLDLRLTLPQVSNTLGERILDGVFIQGKTAASMYAGNSFMFPTSSNQEDVFVTGDGSGYLYRMFYDTVGTGANDYDFTYDTNFLDQNKPRAAKRYEKVIAWVEGAGNWDLTLDYWTDFKTNENDKNTISVQISTADSGEIALWDVGRWDEAQWDGYIQKPRPIVFNLQAAPYNNAEGEVIKLRFRNQNSEQPILIYGYSILYSDIGVRN